MQDQRRLIGLAVLCLFVLGVLFGSRQCMTIVDAEPVEGSQGYRVWSSDTLKSFEHDGGRVCVPFRWAAVGAVESGWGWAQFEPGKTGVVIRSSSFDRHTVEPENSSYAVTILYPTAVDVQPFLPVITHAFTSVGALFNDGGERSRVHTVLITAGLAGNTRSEGTRVYPDPTDLVSMFVRTPDHSRAEELFVHALMHLYNRQRDDMMAYQKLQKPFTPEDWQEAEATWAEAAFSTFPNGREERLKYLYNVHIAVVTKDYSLISGPPFNNQEEFEKITPRVSEPHSTYLDYQYGHYILAPLLMVAIDGLLQERSTGIDVKTLLTDLHAGSEINFFERLAELLPAEDVARIRLWEEGGALISQRLIESVMSHYDE